VFGVWCLVFGFCVRFSVLQCLIRFVCYYVVLIWFSGTRWPWSSWPASHAGRAARSSSESCEQRRRRRRVLCFLVLVPSFTHSFLHAIARHSRARVSESYGTCTPSVTSSFVLPRMPSTDSIHARMPRPSSRASYGMLPEDLARAAPAAQATSGVKVLPRERFRRHASGVKASNCPPAACRGSAWPLQPLCLV
jgi:hypothetical protein